MGNYNGALPSGTLAVGAGLPAAWTQQTGLAVTALGSAWTTYTPALTAFTTNPTLGTGSVQSGRYTQVGKFVVASFDIRFGTSGTAAGSGQYYVSLPVNADTTQPAVVGIAYLQNGALGQPVSVLIDTTARVSMFYPSTWPAGTSSPVGSAAPWAWGVSHILRGTITYQAA